MSLTSGAESPEFAADTEDSLTDEKELAADTEDSLTDENLPSVLEQIDAPKVQKVPISLYIPTQNEVICRKEAGSGTRLLKLVCRSKAQIEAESAESQRLLRHARL